MTRLYLWTVCAVALVGCHKETNRDVYADVPDEVVARMGVRRGPPTPEDSEATNAYFTNTTVEPHFFTNLFVGTNVYITNIITTNILSMSVCEDTKEVWLVAYHGDPTNYYWPAKTTTLESTHQPTLTHSNNVWIIRFEP